MRLGKKIANFLRPRRVIKTGAKYDASRRLAIAKIAALGVTPLLSGCASILRSCGIDLVRIEPDHLRHADPTLPFAVFDTHSHIFNGRDLQVAGYIRGPVANDIKNPVVAEALRRISEFAEVFAHNTSPSVQDEAKALSQAAPVSLEPEKDRAQVPFSSEKLLLPKEEKEARSLLLDLLNQSEFKRHLREAARTPQNSGQLYSAPFLVTGDRYTEEELDRILNAREQRSGSVPYLLLDRGEGGAIAFLKHILSYRHHNIRTMWDRFGENKTVRPDAFLCALVDFDYWLEKPGQHRGTPSCLRDQILISKALALRSGGAILPLVPFNPWTDWTEKGRSIHLVKEAITKNGFVGVKIYPVLGYAPYGNADLARNNKAPLIWRELDTNSSLQEIGEALDNRMRELFIWCAQNEVPVMAHANHSKGTGEDTLDLAGPEYWGKALSIAYTTTHKPLRVNLGHFGGESMDHCGASMMPCWQKDFVDLMNRPEGRWLYADIAYWDVFLSGKLDTIKYLAQELIPGRPLYTHLTYGSDWYMIVNADGYQDYAENFYQWTQSLDPNGPLAQYLFQNNMAALFGLRAIGDDGEPPATRKRLETFYRSHNLPPPVWMTKLDASSL